MKNAVVITTDAGMFPAAMFLVSRLAALTNRTDVEIVVVTPTPDDAPHSSAQRVPFSLVYASEDPRFQQLASQYGPIQRISHYRVFLPAVFAREYERILYLDTDIYVTDARVFDLFDLDMEGLPIAAVRDLSIGFSALRKIRAYRHQIVQEDRAYLNAGVLLIDTPMFNRMNLLPLLMAPLAREKIPLRYAEQSSLNQVLRGKWLELSPAFNMFPQWKDTFVWKAYPPAIVHFVGRVKPWTELRYFELPGIQDEMRQYIAGTPWKHFFASQRTSPDERRYLLLRPVIRYRMRFLWPVLKPFFRRYPFEVLDWKKIASLLASGRFADVAAGMTRPNLACIPRHLYAGMNSLIPSGLGHPRA